MSPPGSTQSTDPWHRSAPRSQSIYPPQQPEIRCTTKLASGPYPDFVDDRRYLGLGPAGDIDVDPAEVQARVRRVQDDEALGRSAPDTVAGYEALVSGHGPDGFAAGIISRANRRWENLVAALPFTGSIAFPHLWRLPLLDIALASRGLSYRVEATVDIAPAALGSDWLGQLRWGLDSAVAATRFQLLCQPIGAAAVLRQQLERWTANRAHTLDLRQHHGELTADFYSRVWYGAPIAVEVGAVYRSVSDLLHGRGPMLPLLRWETGDLASWPPPVEIAATELFAAAGGVVQHQVLACVMDLAEDDEIEKLLAWPAAGSPPPEQFYAKVQGTLLPLSPPVLATTDPRPLIATGEIYEAALEREAAADGQFPAASLVLLSYLHRRHRAYQAALAAFELEDELVGAEGDLNHLANLEARYILVGETAALTGMWLSSPAGDALIVASSALRSAFHLWLEDDMRSMIAARTIYEMVARARAWRLKPARAARLEERGERTTMRDWTEAAGWRRLAVLNRALGELSHIGMGARWGGAMEGLRLVADQPTINTARGASLGRAAHVLAAETVRHLEVLSPALASAAASVLGLSDETEERVGRWVASAAAHRAVDFGEPEFRPMTPAEMDAVRQSAGRKRPDG